MHEEVEIECACVRVRACAYWGSMRESLMAYHSAGVGACSTESGEGH